MRIGVVGMGAAGIHASRMLSQAGFEVECFEARDRVGGRLLTVSSLDGQPVDAGGEWIDADHHRVLALAAELGIGIDRSPRPPGRVYFRGDWAPENQLWRAALGDESRFEARAEELARSLPESAESIQGLNLQWLIDQTAQTEAGRFWLGAKLRSDEGDDPERIGLVGWLDFYRKYLDRSEPSMSAFRIQGGLGAMMVRAAESFPIRHGFVLRGVDDRVEHALLQFGDEVREVDRVILALPKTIVDSILLAQPMPADQEAAMAGIAMGRAMKVVLAFDSAWWNDVGWNGCLHSDGPIQQLWAAPYGLPTLCAYLCGDTAVDSTSKDMGDALAEHLFSLFPEARSHFLRYEEFDWTRDPFAQGGFPYSTPEDSGRSWQTASKPHGRVHFAGDWAASWMGFVEGALESAERVVEEILNA